MPTNRVVRLVVNATQEGSIRSNTFHFATAADQEWTEAELQTLCSNYWANVRLAYKALCGIGVNFTSVVATEVGEATPTQGVYNITQPEPGTAGGDAAPANVACCVAWKTPLASRRTRGRTYLFGVTDGHASGSIFNPTYLSLVATWANLVYQFNNGAGVAVSFCIYSKTWDLVTPVTAYIVDAFSDSQRKRLPGRGA